MPDDETPLLAALAAAKKPNVSETPLQRAADFARLVRVRVRGIPDDSPPLRPEEGLEHWTSVLKRRTHEHYDAVVLLTGVVGSGKSTLAFRMATRIDPTFDVRTRLCYSPAALMACYQTIRNGQVVVWDEGVRGLLAGDQATAEQKAVVQTLALIREKGAVLFICAPSIWLIAKQVRQGRAFLWVHALQRGLAVVHERVDKLRYEPDMTLGFYQSEVARMLTWKPYPPRSQLWTTYLKEKNERLDDYLADTREMLERKEGRKKSARAENASAGSDDEIRRRLGAHEAWSKIRRELRVGQRRIAAIAKELSDSSEALPEAPDGSAG